MSISLRTAVVTFLALPVGGSAQDDWDSVQIEKVSVRDGIYMLVGRGGNIGLSMGEDGTFLIDDQYAPLTDKIVAAIRTVTDDPVRFLVNTHWHGDHTGGNENFGRSGSILVAHENVRRRMSVENVRTILSSNVTPPSPKGALPVITFTEDVTFHWNADAIHAFHVETAHTDGDVIIHFQNADVFHMGDVFLNGRYPFVDVDSGGNVNGIVAAADRVLEMTTTSTKIIPGHGDLGGPSELRAYRDMIVAVRDRVSALMREGKSIEEILAAKPTAAFEAEWGTQSERFVRGVYHSLAKP